MSSTADETYLEAVMETISADSLPHDIRRHMELLRRLDESTSSIVDQLIHAEDRYVARTRQVMMDFELPTPTAASSASGMEPQVIVPTTEELRALVEDPKELARIRQLRRDARELIDEKVSVSEQAYAVADAMVKRLDRDLASFESLLKGTGEFETPGGAKPNDLAAIQVNLVSNDWILAKVISHDPETGMYSLSDEDVESNKIFHLPESQVVVLGGIDRLSRGDVIYAVYPDTTSFYQAAVVQPPRKVQGGSSFVMVHFKDDHDEHGVTHDKAVLMKHVMLPP